MLKRKVLLLAILAIVFITLAPVSALFAGQNQLSIDLTAEKVVEIAQTAEAQVKNLIDYIYANDEALQKITDAKLMENLEGNVSLHEEGVVWLTSAEQKLESSNYNQAIIDAKEALQDFRQALKSINWILQDVGLKPAQEVDATSLLDSINRALTKIQRLRELLPTDAVEQMELLIQAEDFLNLEENKNLLAEGKLTKVSDNLSEANQLISQVYQYLKFEAELSNTERIYGYLQGTSQMRERFRERFGQAIVEGVDVTAVLNSLGYKNEEEFMQTLQNMTQDAQGEIGNMDNVLHQLESINHAIQQMDQSLTQEMNRHQHGQKGNDYNTATDSGNGALSESGNEPGNTNTGTGATGTSGNTETGNTNTGTGTTDIGNGFGNSGTTGGDGHGSGPSSSGSGSGSGAGGSGR